MDKRPIMNMQPITVEGRKVYAWTGDPWFQERAFRQRTWSSEEVRDKIRRDDDTDAHRADAFRYMLGGFRR